MRGFAFFLGLSTILDLLLAYFFMHPLVSILARNPRLVGMPGVGIAAGLDAPEAIGVTPATAEAEVPEHTRHTLKDLYHERTYFQFIDHSPAVGDPLRGPHPHLGGRVRRAGAEPRHRLQGRHASCPFTVGHGSADSTDIRDTLKPLGLGDAKVLIVGDKDVRVQVAGPQAGGAAAGGGGAREVRRHRRAEREHRPRRAHLGRPGELEGAPRSLVFFAVIALYLTFRFEWSMALAAIIAVVHDIIITVGVYAVTQFEVTPATVIAFLTILGFSLYDTVVVFDKIKENQARIGTVRGDTYTKMVEPVAQPGADAVAQHVVRRAAAGGVAALRRHVVFGGLALRDFALALFVGLLIGAYSSIFVATPLLAWLKEREPRYRALRERAAAELARAPVPARAAPKAAPKAAPRPTPKAAPQGRGRAPSPMPPSDDTPRAGPRSTEMQPSRAEADRGAHAVVAVARGTPLTGIGEPSTAHRSRAQAPLAAAAEDTGESARGNKGSPVDFSPT